MGKQTENQIRRIIKKLINESIEENSNFVIGSSEINNLKRNLKPGEEIWLDDSGGQLVGTKVTKEEYLKRMLKKAVDSGNWNTVKQAILYMDTAL